MDHLNEVAIVFSFTENQIKNLWQLYKEEWWSKNRTLNETKSIIQASDLLIGITLTKTGQLIGFLRVLTDFVAVAVIYDVMIHKDYRNRRLGAYLMKQVIQHPKLKSVKFIDLFCKPEMNAFYQQFGFDFPSTGTNILRLKYD